MVLGLFLNILIDFLSSEGNSLDLLLDKVVESVVV